jgi:hypothetical protein
VIGHKKNLVVPRDRLQKIHADVPCRSGRCPCSAASVPKLVPRGGFRAYRLTQEAPKPASQAGSRISGRQVRYQTGTTSGSRGESAAGFEPATFGL